MNRKILLFLVIAFSIVGIVFSIIFKPRMKFNKIIISDEEWNSIINTREEGNLSLKSIKFNDYDLVIDDINHKVYYSVIQNSASKFSPFVSFVANKSNTKIAILNDEITEEKIMNNYEFKVLLYDDSTYKIYGLYCTTFPMLNIICNAQDDAADNNIPMSMYLFSNLDNGINRIVKSDGTLNKIEMADGTYDYKFSLVMTTPGNKERENVISLLHMKPSDEYFLNAINTAENNSPIRNNMKEQMKFNEKYNIKFEEKSPEFDEKNNQRVELFINNEYVGLYSLGYDPDNRVRPKNR